MDGADFEGVAHGVDCKSCASFAEFGRTLFVPASGPPAVSLINPVSLEAECSQCRTQEIEANENQDYAAE
jgi:hypothetical protein